MRVTFISPKVPFGPVGGLRVVYRHANALASAGHDVAVVHTRQVVRPGRSAARLRTWKHTLRLRQRIRREGYPSPHWEAVDPRVDMRFVPSLAPRHLPNADAVIYTAWWTAELLHDAPARLGRPGYLIQHLEDWDGAREDVERTWLYPIPKVVVSGWLRDHAVGLGVPPEQVEHIPPGVDHQVFRITRPIAPRLPGVALLAHPAEYKGTRRGVDVVARMRDTHPGLRLRVFGKDPRPPYLPEWAEYTQDPSQSFLVDGLYNASSVFLSPSRIEGWGLTAAEAMACGAAVVAVDNRGIRDFARHGENALLSDQGDDEALAVNLARMITDDRQRIQLAEAGRRTIEGFTWQASSRRFESWLRQNLDR